MSEGGWWSYADWFEPLEPSEPHDCIKLGEQYVEHVAIETHEFFSLASQSVEALKVWVGQELVVTGPTAKLMLRLASMIDNVHLRSRMAAVAWGEHSIPKNGIARRAHPWLLHRLGASIGVEPRSVEPLPETILFLETIADDCCALLPGIAAIGLGNERLIIPEYQAVKESFAKAAPDSAYEEFLDANINEDVRHSALLREVAAVLITLGADPAEYLSAGMRAVDARIHYYDNLVKRMDK
jgi:hypothetical protein